MRVKARKAVGGHDVPIDKIVTRYERALKCIPELIDICDVCHVYDNSDKSSRIFKKRKEKYFLGQRENCKINKNRIVV